MGEGVPFGDFELIRRLGVGGMAEVFLVKRRGPEGFQKRLVIKRLLPHLNRSQTYIDLFLKEARMAALVDHPNLAHVSDFGQVDGRHYMAMEYVDGLTVSVFLDKLERTPLGIAVRVAIDVLAGLEALHTARAINGDRLNLVHRDITPRNVMLTRGGNVKLLDLGIAVQAKEADQKQAGTKNYMSPEQALGQDVDARADLYSVALLVIRMLCGRIDVQHRAPHPKKPHGVPEDLWTTLKTALSFEADDRYSSAQDFLRALERFAGVLGEESNRSFLAERVAEIMPSLTQVMRMDPDDVDDGPGPVTQTAAPEDDVLKPLAPLTPLDPNADLEAILADDEGDSFEIPTDEVLHRAHTTPGGLIADTRVDPAKLEIVEIDDRIELAATIPFLNEEPDLLRTRAEPPAVAPGSVPVPRSDTKPAAGPVPITAPDSPPLHSTRPDEPEPGRPSRRGWVFAALAMFVVTMVYFALSREVTTGDTGPAAAAEVATPADNTIEPEVVEATEPEVVEKREPRRRKKNRRRANRRRRAKPPKSKPTKSKPPKSKPKVVEEVPKGRGYLTINTRPWTVVHVDGKRLDVTPIERAELSAGRHDVRMVNAKAGIDRRTTITVKKGRVVRVSREF